MTTRGPQVLGEAEGKTHAAATVPGAAVDAPPAAVHTPGEGEAGEVAGLLPALRHRHTAGAVLRMGAVRGPMAPRTRRLGLRGGTVTVITSTYIGGLVDSRLLYDRMHDFIHC